jgi:hypothetical protein
VEANTIYCSSRQGQSHYKPHWESRPLPNRNIADHGIRGPGVDLPLTRQELSRGRFFNLVLWLVAVFALGAAVLFLALRAGALPEAWQDHIEEILARFSRPRARNFGAPYRAPPVRAHNSQYVAPAPPSNHAHHGTDQELDKIVGDDIEEH